MASWFAKEGARVVRNNLGYFFEEAEEHATGVRIYGTGEDHALER